MGFVRINAEDVRWLARLLWQGAGLVTLMWLVMLGVML